MRPRMHDGRMQLKPDHALADLSRLCHPVLRGGMHSYGGFYMSALYPTLRHRNRALVHRVRRQYPRVNRHRRRAAFAHWQMGMQPTAG
jgi:RNA-directed DNA polymerase